MTLAKEEKVARAKDELQALSVVIDFAEQMIAEERELREFRLSQDFVPPAQDYRPLRRHAYGKTVVIESERAGTLIFRLGATPLVVPGSFATPHSPVGRLCAILRPGDEHESSKWGSFRCCEIRLFDRYDGVEFEANVRNFLRMSIQGNSGAATVENLRAYLISDLTDSSPTQINQAPDGSLDGQHAISPGQHSNKVIAPEIPQAPAPSVPLAENRPRIAIHEVTVLDDTNEGAIEIAVVDGDLGAVIAADRQSGGHIGLNEIFYINRTREQDAVVSRSPLGPMFVEGIAGSGKTAAALARMKMLVDFRADSVTSEEEFEAIVGKGSEHWDGSFVGKFTQEGCVGFVRTGELVQYLKETCRRLDLVNMPIKEYPELRHNLRQVRRIDRARAGAPKWKGLAAPRGSNTDTTMSWLRSADRALSSYFAEVILDRLPKLVDLMALFSQENRTFVERVISAALDALTSEVRSIAAELMRGRSGDKFVLDGLASKLDEAINRVHRKVLGRDTLWASIGDRWWIAATEREMARQLVESRVAIFLNTSSQFRLIFASHEGLEDPSLTLLSETGETMLWNDETRNRMKEGRVLVRDAAGLTVRAMEADTETLYLHLLPQAISKPFILQGGVLRHLSLRRGMGRMAVGLRRSAMEVGAETARGKSNAFAVKSRRQRMHPLDRVFLQVVRRALFEPLSHLADSYATAVSKYPEVFPDLRLVQKIAIQLAGRELAEEDIDLLLCLAHLIGRGFRGAQGAFSGLPFFQAVFIDEVQDFTEQQIFLMVEQSDPASRAVTVVGDPAQKLHNGDVIDIKACFPGTNILRVRLTENLRQFDEPGLAWFSQCVRAIRQDICAGLMPAASLTARIQARSGSLRIPEFLHLSDAGQLVKVVVDTLAVVSASHTAAVILPDGLVAAELFALCAPALSARMVDAELSERIDLSRRYMRHFTSVENAKGLEFDVVIVPFLERYRLSSTFDMNRLYVAVTRPRYRLVLISTAQYRDPKFERIFATFEAGLNVR